jgi:multidrug efflux pump subunit AcrA (membrane-fusion protein)
MDLGLLGSPMSTAPPLSPFAGMSTPGFSGAGNAAPHAGRPDAAVVAEMQHEIRVLVQEIAQIAQSDLPPDDFYGALLTRVVAAMGAVGGAVWAIGEGGRLRCAYQLNLAQSGLDLGENRPRHGQLLKKVLAGNQAILVPPQAGASGSDEAANPSDLLLVLAPLVVDSQPHAVVEIFQRPGAGPTTQRGYLRFLIQMCDLACDYLKNRRLRQLEENQSLWRQLEQFVQAIHASLDVRETSYALVNEGRLLVGCDRVSLALAYGGRCRIEAVSGLDTIDRRAAEVRRLGELATAVLRTGEPLRYNGPDEELPPQIGQPLQHYVDLAHAKLVAVLPLVPGGAASESSTEGSKSRRRRQPIGAIIIEQLRDGRSTEALHVRGRLVAQHGAQALASAIDHSSLPLLPIWGALGRATWLLRGRALPRSLLVVAALVAGAAALATVQTDFEVAARGKLQPVMRREVFAQIDGIVKRVGVRHGQAVVQGAVLAELGNTNVELELAALIGRQTTNREQIAAHQRALLDSSTASGVRLSPAEESRLSGDLIQLRQESQNLERELALLQEKQQQLVVKAGEAGEVVTWQVEQLLHGRPVIRGQSLMTLANPDGPWELELYVPERRLVHIQTALSNAATGSDVNDPERPPLDVVFTLSSHAGSQYRGRVVEIEQTAEVRGEDGNTVLVRVAIDKDQLPPLHDQTTVTAKLYCGRTSLGFAWFCDAIEAVQQKVIFWLP